ncbi:UBA-like [Ostreococcus tauri]|uniref:UBA-like n=1 Tax=Ostreococcus tauri TaxID=70448 RepID=A0A096P8K5_OSTTA|nr:UBA-like [Ostreococcus tauri]OUS44233.1 hypothetical protein BE221DRAFT_193674 [Ostreococcus tauri]CEG00299.1 UBA-like [Ostreococcus tauri]|eukprot:XP_003083522.2 UBA-like [Ostreococcus tauri]
MDDDVVADATSGAWCSTSVITASMWGVARTRGTCARTVEDGRTRAALAALAAARRDGRRATLESSIARWRSACARRVGNERAVVAMRRRWAFGVKRRYFERWRAQTPSARRGGREWGTNRFGVVDDGEMDEEFPVDYRAELEIRLSQISRLEEALREAKERERNERERNEQPNAEAQMKKFREHLQNMQREMEGVKRERDAYRKKWETSVGPAAEKAAADRRANQRTMATQTVFAEEDRVEAQKELVEKAKKSQIRAAEEKWMEQARLFEQKFERQMQVASEYEIKLREERARLTRSEAQYEARLEELTAKHAETEAELLALRGSLGVSASGGGSFGDFSRERFAQYAKIGAGTAAAQSFPNVSPLRSPSPEVPETFASPTLKLGDLAIQDTPGAGSKVVEDDDAYQSAKKFTFADFSSEDEDEVERENEEFAPPADDRLTRTTSPSIPLHPSPPPQTSAFTKKPLRLTVAVAKLVVLGHSQRDAIEALKHVDNNDVHAAVAWLARRHRA